MTKTKERAGKKAGRLFYEDKDQRLAGGAHGSLEVTGERQTDSLARYITATLPNHAPAPRSAQPLCGAAT